MLILCKSLYIPAISDYGFISWTVIVIFIVLCATDVGYNLIKLQAVFSPAKIVPNLLNNACNSCVIAGSLFPLRL